jgi:hypothetical protein
MTDAWSSDLYHLGGTAGYIGCRAFTTAVTSTTTSTDTPIGMGGEEYDSDPNGAMHDTVTLNNRITIRTTGIYHIGAQAIFASNATGYRTVSIRKNGVIQVQHQVAPISGISHYITTFASLSLAANDYVEMSAYQTSGGALDVSGNLSVVKA